MRVGALRERHPGEARVAMTPASAQDIRKLGHECHIEAGAGEQMLDHLEWLRPYYEKAWRAAGRTTVV